MSGSRDSIRRKLVRLIVVATLPLLVGALVSVTALGLRAWRTAVADVERVTCLVHDAFDSALRESIVSYLRAKAETALLLIENADASPPGAVRASAEPDGAESQSAGSGNVLSTPQRLDDGLAARLAEIPVASTGYVYILDRDGGVVYHPDSETQGRTIPDQEPVATQLRRRTGYLQYVWQNSFEPQALPKALYMLEYEPRGWIVAATSYRSEFVDLVDRDRMLARLGVFEFGADGYTTIVSSDGTFVAHPTYQGGQIRDVLGDEEAERLRRELFANEVGQTRYSWPSQPNESFRPKLMFSRYLADFDWAIATTVYIDTLRRPVIIAAGATAAGAVVGIGILVFFALRMARSIGDPIQRLAVAAEHAERLPDSRIRPNTPREVASLAERFNAFMSRIALQQELVAEREDRLERSLNEKTVLIRELHHRVKNNLQVIASLLSLQARDVSDPRDAKLFERSRQRVLSMAMVHEQLHQTEDLATIPFDAYLSELVAHLSRAASTERVSVRVNATPVVLELYRAVPCGLIVNELVTNALEHAFPCGRAGTITVSLSATDDRYVLEVSDDGVGFAPEGAPTLGMTLVGMLARQLEGTLETVETPGTMWRLEFPLESGAAPTA